MTAPSGPDNVTAFEHGIDRPVEKIELWNTRPEPGALGPCYECADGLHGSCLGVPCACECPDPRGAARLTERFREERARELPELGRVYRVDALDGLRLLPDASCDMLLTDPPYSSGGFTRSDRAQDPSQKYARSDSPDGRGDGRISFTGDNRDGRSWAYWMQLWLSECQRIVKPGGKAGIFTDWRQLPLATDAFQAGGFVWRGVIAWDKGESARAPHKGYARHQCEYLVWGSNGALAPDEHDGPYPGCYRFSTRQDDKFHMTGKPTELMRELVKLAAPGAIVLDPFAGSGTTLVAAELEGRRGLGFELAAENVRIANERIQGAKDSLDGKAARERQTPLFKSPDA